MSVKNSLVARLKNIISEMGEDFAPAVDAPVDLAHGDFTANAAMVLAKSLKRNPMEVAEQIAAELKTSKNELKFIEKIEVARPGFINFHLSKDYLLTYIDSLINNEQHSDRGTNSFTNKKFMIEFAHPNTHKALHIGHIRNITTGESLVRLLESQGAEVIRANYQGDVGMHIAKAFYGLLDIAANKEQLPKIKGVGERVVFLGKAYSAGSTAYESDEKAKQKIHDYNYLIYACAQRFQQEKGIPAGSTDYLKFVEGRKEDLDEVYSIWKETRQWSLDYYEEMYKILYTRFDRYYFESECLQGVDLAKEAVEKGVLKESEGAIIFDGTEFGLDTRVFVNSLGLPTYEAKELALAEKEFSEFSPLEKVIHIVGPEQASFFKTTFKAEELLDPEKYKDKQLHLAYGWVRLKHGKMSSRLGNVVTAGQLLDEARQGIRNLIKANDFAQEEKEKIIEAVAVAAVKYSFLKVSTNQEIAFDLQESISFDGNSGPYLQYTYARTQSVLRKAATSNSPFQISGLQKEEEDLLRLLVKFDGTVAVAAGKFSPNILCNYLFTLAQAFNLFYQKHQILKEEGDTRDFRLALTKATGKVIKSGLNLLGIHAPERM